jgi:hypothetical protein
MKTQNQSKIHNFWNLITGCLQLSAKTLRGKFAAKGRSFEPFPNEAPH